jgi:uroporphyrinogen III methyltransferase/synthase
VSAENIAETGVKTGTVRLVGAGPGDPELLTLKAQAAIEAASVVVYDRLVSEEILFLIPSSARLIPVGKSPGNHPVPQEEINRVLLEEARAGNTVVRLKGGDPLLFGRGGEEMLFLAENGIACEIIPGVSSVLAAAADACIPLTHRKFSSSVHIISWRKGGGGELEQDVLEALARSGGTLVILMGASALRDIARRLVEAGFSRDLPAALIENAARPRRRVRILTVGELETAECPAAPAVIMAGEVCRLAKKTVPGLPDTPDAPDALDTPGALAAGAGTAAVPDKPLAGQRIVVTMREPANAALCRKIRDLGGRAIPFPCIKIVPLCAAERATDCAGEETRSAAGKFSWIVFTSTAGVDIFFETRAEKAPRLFPHCRFAVIGPETAQALKKRGFVPAYMPDTYSARSLGEGLAAKTAPGEKVLLVRGRRNAAGLTEALTENGVSFQELSVYDTLPAEGGEYARTLIAGGCFDYVFFASPSAVRVFTTRFHLTDFPAIQAVCIGETTADCARKSGMNVHVPAEASIEGMLRAVHGRNSPAE